MRHLRPQAPPVRAPGLPRPATRGMPSRPRGGPGTGPPAAGSACSRRRRGARRFTGHQPAVRVAAAASTSRRRRPGPARAPRSRPACQARHAARSSMTRRCRAVRPPSLCYQRCRWRGPAAASWLRCCRECQCVGACQTAAVRIARPQCSSLHGASVHRRIAERW